MEDIHRILEEITLSNQAKVLATILKVEGSGYKKEGATLLILEDKSRIGMLSAGCLEEDLVERAKQVFLTGEPLIFQYDLSDEDDLSWGQGVGCNSVLTVQLELVNEELEEYLRTVQDYLDSRKSVTRIVRLSEVLKPLEEMYLVEDGTIFGSGNFIDQDFVKKLQEQIPLYTTKKGLIKEGTDLYFVHPIVPKPRLFVFGAGEDARPFVSMAADIGFDVTVIDWRPSYCQSEHFPKAKQLIESGFQAVLEDLGLTKRDFVVLMTHSFQKDQMILQQLNHVEVFYLGILGPKARTDRLLGGMKAPSDLYSPIGLSIGAEGPEEIAISILGEMIEKIRYQESSL